MDATVRKGPVPSLAAMTVRRVVPELVATKVHHLPRCAPRSSVSPGSRVAFALV
ncbi:hypothetical protein [Paenarthrobacter sp. C1]|uniref:hypothetical protein n=1 Tax=Paenarthrobacter sp. C1 TaxID=3400220 RepID=UPI003BF5C98D